MKITKSQLREIIREEIQRLDEGKTSDFFKKTKELIGKGLLNVNPKRLAQQTYMNYMNFGLDIRNKNVKDYIDKNLGDTARTEFYKLLKNGLN